MPVRRASDPWLKPMMFTDITTLPTSLVFCLQTKFGKVPSTPIVLYIIFIHVYALYMHGDIVK